MTGSPANKAVTSIHFTNPLVSRTISNDLITYLPQHIQQVIVLCIGTDRSTGDALGPLTGTLFEGLQPKNMKIYGTLDKPVHAINLETNVKEIQQNYPNAFVIAIDASLGKVNSVGHFHCGIGSIIPGAALKKNLPAVGDAFITGVVNIAGLMEFTVLQSTRLSLVYEMSSTLSKVLADIDRWIGIYQLNQTKKTPTVKINNQYT